MTFINALDVLARIFVSGSGIFALGLIGYSAILIYKNKDYCEPSDECENCIYDCRENKDD